MNRAFASSGGRAKRAKRSTGGSSDCCEEPCSRSGRAGRHAGCSRSSRTQSGQTPDFFLGKHLSGDWGEVDAEDCNLNDQALLDGSRLLSAYRTLKGVKIWIITEAADDDGRRASTCILLPDKSIEPFEWISSLPETRAWRLPPPG